MKNGRLENQEIGIDMEDGTADSHERTILILNIDIKKKKMMFIFTSPWILLYTYVDFMKHCFLFVVF